VTGEGQIPAPRRAGPDSDWTGTLALLRAAFAFMEGRIDPPSSLHRLTAEDISAMARDGEVWLIGDAPDACVFLTLKPGALYLGKLAVTDTARGQGYARRLIALAETRARAHALPVLELQTRVELTENQATFRALGFVETGRTAHPGYGRPTSITFRRDVAAHRS
jgi:ribosomal protein S18 acetylase RimI-like enzyme